MHEHQEKQLQDLRAALQAGAASGQGVDANSVLDRLERKYQAKCKAEDVSDAKPADLAGDPD